MAGAAIGTLPRLRAIPGRHFYDFDNVTAKDPFDVMADAGMNAVRVETGNGQCLGPSVYNNTRATARELNFLLDFGCIDAQVEIAREAKARQMKVVLTLNMGATIPAAWENYSYVQMLGAIDGEVRRQLKPFLAERIQPDIVLLENEGTDGFLFKTKNVVTGKTHYRGFDNDNTDPSRLRKELCGEIPTGNIISYPQLAGYYKQEVASAQDALTKAGLPAIRTRFGLHSHGQYFNYKQDVVYNGGANAELTRKTASGTCDFRGIIPDRLLNYSAANVLDIIGYSGYPNPMRPSNRNDTSKDPGAIAAFEATLQRTRSSLAHAAPIVDRYGRWPSGPFAGQWKKQILAVEYATTFFYPQEITAQQEHTQRFFETVKKNDSYLGALWWEPHYVFNNYEGGHATLYHRWIKGNTTNQAPTDTLKTWFGAARSYFAS